MRVGGGKERAGSVGGGGKGGKRRRAACWRRRTCNHRGAHNPNTAGSQMLADAGSLNGSQMPAV
eukprot:365311-Chlamydomonas_euryale.AAC.4